MARRSQRALLLGLAALASATSCVLAMRDSRNDEALAPGWRGSDYAVDPTDVNQRMSKMKVLDARARIYMFENFLSEEECDHIIRISEPRMERSGVVDAATGGSTISNIRTSSGVFLDRGEDEVIKRIEARMAAWTLLPVNHGEGLQVLRYQKDQQYRAHWDYFFHKEGVINGGNRYATVLSFLVDTEEGGETVFPNIPAPGGDNGPEFSDCARYHLAVKPKKGMAVLFHSIQPTGDLERKSLHTACPVIRGVKWSAAKWIHVGRYALGPEDIPEPLEQRPQKPSARRGRAGVCEDLDELCPEWAASGECERNAAFTVGTRARPGKCIKACRRCDLVEDTGAEEQQYSSSGTTRGRRISMVDA